MERSTELWRVKDTRKKKQHNDQNEINTRTKQSTKKRENKSIIAKGKQILFLSFRGKQQIKHTYKTANSQEE